MVKASSFWLAVRADLLCSVLITAVAFAFVLLSQEPGKGMQLRFNQMFIITEILLRYPIHQIVILKSLHLRTAQVQSA